MAEHAKSDSEEDIKSAAKDFYDTAKKRKKELEGHIVKFLEKNGVKDMSTQALFNVSIDASRDKDVRKRADNLYMTHASLGNIMDMAEKKMR